MVNMQPNQLINIFCRLKTNDKGKVVSHTFAMSNEATSEEGSVWTPSLPIIDPQMDVESARYIIEHVGDLFCEMVKQEKEAMSSFKGSQKKIYTHAELQIFYVPV